LAADIAIREVEPRDIDTLDAFMREADRDEIVASHGPDTRATIARAVAISTHCLSVEDAYGDLVCIMGVAPVSMAGGIGSPWMLGTDGLGDLSRTLARVAHRYFAEVSQVYPVLENHVDVRNTASVKLLKWLGCSFDEPKPYGVMGLPFMRFERRSA
jgi:hypothetical protein